MDKHPPDLNRLSRVINARGTYTPLGVSKSSAAICKAVAESLSQFFLMDELHDLACKSISDFAGSEAAAVTHCTASAITVSVAASMTGPSEALISRLPDTGNLANRVVIPSSHCVNYGQSILQAVRLSGAIPVVAGKPDRCTIEDIEQSIAEYNVCCLLLVSSKLAKEHPFDFAGAVKTAHKHHLPCIIDGAAQDFRIHELLQTGADLILVSAQKYLASPTAGLVIGRQSLVDSVRAQEKGIGRGMKATKEAICGVLAAIQERESADLSEWKRLQQQKIERFISRCNQIHGLSAYSEPDPTGLPFSRAIILFQPDQTSIHADVVAEHLKSGSPSIWVIDQNADKGELGLELVQVTDEEIEVILEKLFYELANTANDQGSQ